MRTLVTLSVLTFTLAGCGGTSGGGSGGGDGKKALTCSLDGTWSRCQASTTDSQRVTLTVSAGTLHETIDMFSGDTTCGNISNGQFVIDGTLQLDEQGKSTFEAGATDATVTPSQDVFGCGPAQPAYTYLKFNDDCSGFQSAAQAPVCDPAARGSGLDPVPFLRQ